MSALRHLRIVALLEGVSFLLLLFVAMPLRRYAGMPHAVRVAGSAHGLLFIAFVVVLVRAAIVRDWSLVRSLLAFCSSLIPFGTFVLDHIVRKEMATGQAPASPAGVTQ